MYECSHNVPYLPLCALVTTHTHTHTLTHTHTHMNILASTMGNNSFSHLTNNQRHRLDTKIKQYIFIRS